MLGALLVALGTGVLGLSAWLWAACLRLRTLVGFLLAAYLTAWGQLVLSALALSTIDAFARVGVLVALVLWLAGGLVLWWRLGRPRPVALGPRVSWLRTHIGQHPSLVLLVALLTGGYAYLVALGLWTPQNDGDPLVYQLTRAALWRQQESIGLIGVPIEPRLDVNPVVSEIGQATALVLAGSERFVWLLQFSAVGALALTAFGLARRVGLAPQTALFGALLVPALPVIAVQGISAYNDLVAASFVLGSTLFVLGRERREIVPFTLAIALAVGVKFTTPLLLPLVALAGALAQPARRWLTFAVAGALGVALGGGWYVVNLARTGDPDGGLSEFAGQEPVRTAEALLLSVQKLVLDSVERPGTAGPGVVAFMTVGLGVLAWGGYGVMRGRRDSTLAIAGLAIVATPWLVIALHAGLQALFGLLWEATGDDARADHIRIGGASTWADGVISWYGALATVVGVGVTILVIRGVRRRAIDRAGLILALAPWIGTTILAVGITYDPWRGRFLVAAWVMNIALWGLLQRRPAIAACVVAVSALTFCACLVQYFGKPSGIDVLSEKAGPSIWSLERWEAQTVLRGSPREMGEKLVIRFVEENVPDRAPIGVAVWGNDFRFPYFGPKLTRTVWMLQTASRIPPDVQWVVAAPEITPLGCAESWRRVAFDPSGWRIYRRLGPDTCPRLLRLPAVEPGPSP
jgi:hypothetical protein